ncbi:hypothetical protein [Sulfuricurvum sp.]|uniref:hypothetical protein n=1 Tax=Sulfuricurvum sp. TaxID=2025608 RepID=UPI002E31FCF1|nr:hypothetical protein [Sulfuricurvum sp.]HEX5329518.1 hypothetical protein [Sulfuricurvum sp.]
MNKKKLLIASLFTIVIPIQMLYAQDEIRSDFLSIPFDDKNAYEFSKECIPTIGEQSLKEPEKDKISVIMPADKSKPYLAITKGKIYCIPMSENKNPILPLNVFDKTIDFPDMDKDEIIKLRTDLSKQLATTGTATALMVNEKGNAFVIAYLFANDAPHKFYYHAGFLKKGEFDEQKFSYVYKYKGGMSISARGQPSEYTKFFF